MIYSKVLVIRFLYILGLSSLISIIILFLSNALQTNTITTGPYAPKEKVTRISNLIEEWNRYPESINYRPNDKEDQNFNPVVQFINQFSCNQRTKNIIYSSSMKILRNYPGMTKEKYIRSISKFYYPFFRNECIKLIQDLEVAKKINVKGKNQSSSIKGMVKAYLTEDLEWKKKPLCLYHKLQSDELVYLAGSIKHCIVERENIETFLNFPKLKNLTNTARKLEAQTKIKNKQDGSVGGIKSKNFDYLLTLNPNIQLSLNSLEICFEDSVRCDTTILRIDQLEGISIVLIDPFTSGIIGVKCMGSFCSENGLKPLGDLATLRVRSPPASISKLFFGLGIASEGNNNTVEILNQLKTSGNNQSPSGKRNEWWERRAICDGATDRNICSTLIRTGYYINMFGFSTNCANGSVFGRSEGLYRPFDPNCGSIPFIANGDSLESNLSPFLGYLPIQDGLQLNENGIVEFLSWDAYNQFRDGLNKSSIGNDLRLGNTTRIIQASIGGGDSRVSALGVASIISNLFQLKNNVYPILPFMMEKKTDSLSTKKAQSFVLKEDSNSANTVLRGLEQVLMPETSDWKGSGTASKAFSNTFNGICQQKCPILGKTGTVSFQDKNHRGKTLFGGLTDIKNLAKLTNYKIKIKDYNHVAVGIIVSESGNSDVPNRAADLHMKILKYIFFE